MKANIKRPAETADYLIPRTFVEEGDIKGAIAWVRDDKNFEKKWQARATAEKIIKGEVIELATLRVIKDYMEKNPMISLDEAVEYYTIIVKEAVQLVNDKDFKKILFGGK